MVCLKPHPLSFLTLVGRLHRPPVSVHRFGANIALLTAPEAILEAVRLEKAGALSRQAFTHDLVYPILGEGMFSSREADWRGHKQVALFYLKPAADRVRAWQEAAYRAARRAWPAARTRVQGVPFCRGIVQEALLETLFGAGEALDARRLYRLTHRMDTMAEWATFGFLTFGRRLGRKLAGPFQWIGRRDREALERLIAERKPVPGAPAEDPALREELRSLLFAGQDTTATGLAFVLWMLGVHPDRQEAVRREGPQSPLLRRMILETLRLLPPVPTLPARTATTELKIGGVPIPQGTEVIYCLWFAHRRVQDGEAFVPERFEGQRPKALGVFPFGVGPKRCVGEAWAMTTIAAVVAALLEKARIEPDKDALWLQARTVLVPKKLEFWIEPILG
ncbi:hypothetical protein JCM13664_19280 [Methylothermus subterraneus]